MEKFFEYTFTLRKAITLIAKKTHMYTVRTQEEGLDPADNKISTLLVARVEYIGQCKHYGEHMALIGDGRSITMSLIDPDGKILNSLQFRSLR